MLLADELVERRRAHPHGERALARRHGRAPGALFTWFEQPFHVRPSVCPPRVDQIAYVLWCFLVALAGGLVGLVLGNLRLPATVLVAASPAAAAGANIGISAVSAATASIAHIRAGRINWRLFGWMAPPSIAGRAGRRLPLGRCCPATCCCS